MSMMLSVGFTDLIYTNTQHHTASHSITQHHTVSRVTSRFVPGSTITKHRKNPLQGLHNFGIRENLQLTRLVDAADPDVDVIYVSPFEVSKYAFLKV
jgi:predicted glycosyltransferase